ncbi:MAG: 23S rRNA (guanosine(2251)-2'-O)-methyltransferase RlmB [Bacteroidales bacterium]|nr:23S rRNA (guanosine(2251)-2'-O)-methyltransferase RlmB [Bacteroidales bacterium]
MAKWKGIFNSKRIMQTKNQQIYGARTVIEAIESGRNIDKIWIDRKKNNPLIKELIYVAQQHHIPIQFVPEEKFFPYASKNHQGVLAKLSLIEYQSLENIVFDTFNKGQTPLILILDGVTDVRNFGAIARSAISAGVHAIVVEEKGSAEINEDAIKTSAGALLHVPVCREKSLLSTVRNLRNHGLKVVAATEKGSLSLFKSDLTLPLAIIMGSEEKGISPSILKAADEMCFIPMVGVIASLNVSVAAGVMLFECLRQRTEK